MNVGEALLHALRDHGARQVFGIPGDFVLPLFTVVEESAILPLYTLHHQVQRLDSQFAIYREITCDQASLHDPASAPRDVVSERCAPALRLPEAGYDAEAVAPGYYATMGFGVPAGLGVQAATAITLAAQRTGRFKHIEVMIPQGSVSPTLGGFVDALRRRNAN
jgi:thiamine pyrophosphate-dependent acetolactate synthase large subunit-like protein